MAQHGKLLKDLVVGIPVTETLRGTLKSLQNSFFQEYPDWECLNLDDQEMILLKKLGMSGEKEIAELCLFLKQKFQTMPPFYLKPNMLVGSFTPQVIRLEFSDWGGSKGDPAPLAQIDSVSDEGLNRLGARKKQEELRRISIDLFSSPNEYALQAPERVGRGQEPIKITDVGIFARTQEGVDEIQRVVLK